MKINKEAFKELASSLRFELNEQQLQKLYEESEQLLNSLEGLDSLDVNNVTALHYPINNSFNKLREDVPLKQKDGGIYLKNAKHHQGKYIVVK
jgi:aspartyl/glutamyl-tRNA(Asn/Gln) amidotransferase C subunit